DYEIQRAIRAQRVQRPRIIVLHKGKPVYQNHEEADANLVLKAAVASRRHRREIAVMQQRSSFIFGGEKYDAPLLKSDDTTDISSESNKNDMSQDSKLETNSSVEDEVTRLSVTPKESQVNVISEESQVNMMSEESQVNMISEESKVNVISEESNGTKTNNFISEEKINTPRPLAIPTHNSSIVKKVTKSVKKFLGLKKERGRNSVMPIYKFLKKNPLRKDIEEKK
ncbi:11305_t:CDS:1, partial [Acaulospora morrowiae]